MGVPIIIIVNAHQHLTWSSSKPFYPHNLTCVSVVRYQCISFKSSLRVQVTLTKYLSINFLLGFWCKLVSEVICVHCYLKKMCLLAQLNVLTMHSAIVWTHFHSPVILSRYSSVWTSTCFLPSTGGGDRGLNCSRALFLARALL